MDVCRRRWALAAGCLGLLQGCASLVAPPHPLPDHAPPQARECLAHYTRLDAAVDAAGVRDAQEHRIDGFPHLRVNRFAASFREAARHDANVRDALVSGMAALDLHARRIEHANLPEAARLALGELPLAACSRVLTGLDRADPARTAALLDRVRVPDAYAGWKRALGLYPLTSIPFRWGVKRWEHATRAAFSSAPAPGASRWVPPPAGPNLPSQHAPVFEIDVRRAEDRFGAPRWKADGIGIDPHMPVVYTQVAHTRFEGRTLAQLVYTLWFPARPAEHPFDLLSGHLDALVVRLTLDHDGTVLIADSIHACGCFHQFFASVRLQERAPPDPHVEWAFSPAHLPSLGQGDRLLFRIASGTHALTGIAALPVDSAQGTAYALRPADDLRTLPQEGGTGRRSLYGPDGFVAGTERGERFLFWPMGIASPGAMRQWGHHATAFVGRRHFDDADLIEARFARVAMP